MGAFCVFLPDFVIRLIVETRRKRYEERYVRALKAFASSLRSGMSLQQAVQDVSRNPFIAPEICEGFRQIRLGNDLIKSFHRNSMSPDSDYFHPDRLAQFSDFTSDRSCADDDHGLVFRIFVHRIHKFVPFMPHLSARGSAPSY